MEPLKIEGTTDTPFIVFDPASQVFEISGRSYPEDTKEFFIPVLDWLNGYEKHPNMETRMIIKLLYFNSSSYKPLFDIFSKLEGISQNGNRVFVEWHYKEGDHDMREAGEEFSELVNLPFSFHAFQ